ncbi:hypothetical protein ACUXVY_16140 [Chromobacterium haemolyticum]
MLRQVGGRVALSDSRDEDEMALKGNKVDVTMAGNSAEQVCPSLFER